MNSLVAFVRARLDEVDPDDYHDQSECDLNKLTFFGDCTCATPARTRRRVEASGQLIKLCERRWYDRTFGDGLEMALELVAFEWADHPDYREEWKP